MLRNINAFTLGARRIDPKITTQLIITGDWSLPVKEAEAANSMIDQGVDVITCHVDSPKVVVETAERRGIAVCGYHARQNPLAILPVALLLGGISASGGMLQRRLDLPDATVLVLEGVAFMLILASEALYGRLRIFRAEKA